MKDEIHYIEKLFVKDSELQEKIKYELTKDGLGGIQVTALQGQFLEFLCRILKPKKIVEVGVLYGYSLSWILRSEVPAQIWAFEKNELHLEKAKELLDSQAKSTQFILGDAKEELEKIQNEGPFDFIFIDANKGAYPSYLEWAKKNIASGGVIALDNTLFAGEVLNPNPKKRHKKLIEKIKSCNEDLAHDPGYTSLIFPTPDGMTVASKK